MKVGRRRQTFQNRALYITNDIINKLIINNLLVLEMCRLLYRTFDMKSVVYEFH